MTPRGSRKGYWVIRRKTAAKRLRRTLRAIGDWCRKNRHRGKWDQFKVLGRNLDGHYAEHGVTGNGRCLEQVRTGTQKLWRKWLARPSRESKALTWERIAHEFLQRAVGAARGVQRGGDGLESGREGNGRQRGWARGVAVL